MHSFMINYGDEIIFQHSSSIGREKAASKASLKYSKMNQRLLKVLILLLHVNTQLQFSRAQGPSRPYCPAKLPIRSDHLGPFKEITLTPNWLDKVYNLLIDLASTATSDPYPLQLKDNVYGNYDQYDYIVIGGGAAGCVVAARLSEVPENRVLLVEAGHKESGFSRLGTTGDLFWKSKSHHWNYKPVPERVSAYGIKDRRVRIPTAKMLGGGASHNGLLWNRGDPRDYDRWAQLGADGWAYENVFPYYVKMEQIVKDQVGSNVLDRGYHGTKGPVHITGSVKPNIVGQSIIEAVRQMNFPVGDANGKNHAVFGYSWNNLYNGSRESMASNYLAPASFRSNLDVIIHAFVHRINFDDQKRAIGVTYEKDGKIYSVKARKEVILSAGSYGSPKVLMLSGIGPKNELKKFDIPVVADSSGVGQNLQDHTKTLLYFTMEKNLTLVYTEKEHFIQEVIKYQTNRTGSFASLSGRIQGNFRTRCALDERPDGTIAISSQLPGSFESNMVYSYVEDFTDDLAERYLVPQSFKHGLLVEMFNYRTLSRGQVRLQSANPYDDPIIENNYFAVKRDLDVMIEVCLTTLRIFNSKTVQEAISAKPFPNTLPGCEKYPLGSPGFCHCLALTITLTASHPSCTCKMGSQHDPMAVVDSQLRVKGVKGLRVIDASVMPEIVSGNLNAPTVMIAEKGSDHIKGKTLRPSSPPYTTEDDMLMYH
ncbi:L-sorbose 1-dehydrogenase-like [Brevipalpus obovatus]|uniref:L-sorbose 1-dehydrogenase-like n=1 Tax=Brevipalpus obovatus TaxID=246614 RepID=UPI003D9F30E8